jgi:hypothetical protein
MLLKIPDNLGVNSHKKADILPNTRAVNIHILMQLRVVE